MKRSKDLKIHHEKRVAIDIVETVFSKTIDFALWSTVYLSLLPFAYSLHEPLWKVNVEADDLLNSFNYEKLKQAINNAKRRGFIKKTRRHAWPEITTAGKNRLASIVPHYDSKRAWDGRLHIVTYDIPEKQSDDRRILREFLRKIGCGRLQDSVWITPYNPIDTLRNFTTEHNLQSTLIISDMGRDGAIGEENISDLIVRVYKLELLNERYEHWIAEVKRHGKIDHYLMLAYLSILSSDPQLPFPLLPTWWKGHEAYQRVQKDLQKIVNFFPTGKKLTILP